MDHIKRVVLLDENHYSFRHDLYNEGQDRNEAFQTQPFHDIYFIKGPSDENQRIHVAADDYGLRTNTHSNVINFGSKIDTNSFHFGSRGSHLNKFDFDEQEQRSQFQVPNTILDLKQQELHQPGIFHFKPSQFDVVAPYLKENEVNQNNMRSVYLPSSISSLEKLPLEFVPFEHPQYFLPSEELGFDIFDTKSTASEIPETYVSSIIHPLSDLPVSPLDHAFESERKIAPILYLPDSQVRNVLNIPNNLPKHVKNNFPNTSITLPPKLDHVSFPTEAEQSSSNIIEDNGTKNAAWNQNQTALGPSHDVPRESTTSKLNSFMNHMPKTNTGMKKISHLLNNFTLKSNESNTMDLNNPSNPLMKSKPLHYSVNATVTNFKNEKGSEFDNLKLKLNDVHKTINETNKNVQQVAMFNSTKHMNDEFEVGNHYGNMTKKNETKSTNLEKFIHNISIHNISKLELNPNPVLDVIDDTNNYQDIPLVPFINNFSKENESKNNISNIIIDEIVNITYTDDPLSNIENLTSRNSNKSSLFNNTLDTETTIEKFLQQKSPFKYLETIINNKTINDVTDDGSLLTYLNSSIETNFTNNNPFDGIDKMTLKSNIADFKNVSPFDDLTTALNLYGELISYDEPKDSLNTRLSSLNESIHLSNDSNDIYNSIPKSIDVRTINVSEEFKPILKDSLRMAGVNKTDGNNSSNAVGDQLVTTIILMPNATLPDSLSEIIKNDSIISEIMHLNDSKIMIGNNTDMSNSTIAIFKKIADMELGTNKTAEQILFSYIQQPVLELITENNATNDLIPKLNNTSVIFKLSNSEILSPDSILTSNDTQIQLNDRTYVDDNIMVDAPGVSSIKYLQPQTGLVNQTISLKSFPHRELININLPNEIKAEVSKATKTEKEYSSNPDMDILIVRKNNVGNELSNMENVLPSTDKLNSESKIILNIARQSDLMEPNVEESFIMEIRNRINSNANQYISNGPRNSLPFVPLDVENVEKQNIDTPQFSKENNLFTDKPSILQNVNNPELKLWEGKSGVKIEPFGVRKAYKMIPIFFKSYNSLS
ncbi:hypothetical protein NPIL_58931 [Nephila pilipes]|uniref:Uncharacterized protein n=1 Tax=Nephila pilipes TaxID=299642 RepID=A0A8X6PUG1_NEPPI|nr:hypothetical protein NPIL_58931 [Nephila pilipes]